MNIAQLCQENIQRVRNRRNKLHQAFGIIGGDIGMRQRSTQLLRMIQRRQPAFRCNAQRLPLDTATKTAHCKHPFRSAQLLDDF